ncbi:MAG TPA: hypothetical protein VGQ00_03965 [Candidatus Norongarragalinales archaeon]|jgi:hypothetical protein|nr:hypothetical protein [Candidatus Norongarragalinales archaeon]
MGILDVFTRRKTFIKKPEQLPQNTKLFPRARDRPEPGKQPLIMTPGLADALRMKVVRAKMKRISQLPAGERIRLLEQYRKLQKKK